MKRLVTLISLLALLGAAGLLACSSQPEIDGKGIYDWITLLRHDDLSMQEKARDALARMGPPAFAYLQRNLANKDPAIRRGVVMVLGRMGSKAKPLVADVLKALSREEVDIIRAEIMRTLVAIDPRAPGVEETFRKRLRDRSAEVRRLAQQGLDKLAPPRQPARQAASAAQRVPELQLRATLAENLSGQPFALLGEVEREPLRAALVWLPQDSGKNGDRIQVFLFRRRGSQWLEEGKPFVLTGQQGATHLTAVLGGADKQRLVRPCGIAADKLAAYLVQWGNQFDQARRDNDSARMAASLEKLSRAFSYRLVAFEGVMFQLLAAAVLSRPEAVQLAADKKSISLGPAGKLMLSGCGGGQVVSGWQQPRAHDPDSGSKSGAAAGTGPEQGAKNAEKE